MFKYYVVNEEDSGFIGVTDIVDVSNKMISKLDLYDTDLSSLSSYKEVQILVDKLLNSHKNYTEVKYISNDVSEEETKIRFMREG